MDVLIVILFSVLSATSTGVLVAYNMKQTAAPLSQRHRAVYTKYLLPEPGQNFELYTRAQEVMDGLVADKAEAQSETQRYQRMLEDSNAALESSRDEVKRLAFENENLRRENERLVGKIETAQEIVRSFTHSKMRLFKGDPQQRQRLVQII